MEKYVVILEIRIGNVTYLSNNVHSLDDFSKHHVFSIKPTGLDAGNEELAAVGVGTSVRHRKYTRFGMGELEVLVLEPSAIDGFTTSTVVVGEVTTLAHEVRNHPVETAALVPEAFLTGTEGTEVLRGLGNNILSQL